MIDTKLLRQKILDLAIRGKLVPQDPNDEPASELLKRIKAEKEALIKAGKIKRDKHESYIFRGEDKRYYEQVYGKIIDITNEIPFDLPQKWAWCRMGSAVDFIGGSQPPKCDFTFSPTPDSVRLIQIRDYKTDRFKTYIPISKAKRFCSVDDIMIGRYGPPIFQILRGIEGAYNVALMKAVPCNAISKDYLYYLLKDGSLLSMIESLSDRTCGQDGVNMYDLKRYIIAIPPLAEQERIVAKVEALMNEVDTIERETENLNRTFALTREKALDLAIRGKLVPQDPNDEPASELLKKIKAEKETLIKAGKLKRDKHESFIFKGDDNCYYEQIDGKRTDITEDIPFDIPESWCWCRLSVLCDYGSCQSLDAEVIPEDAWVLDLEDIEKETGRLLCRITKRDRPSASSKHVFRKGNVLYSKLRTYLNKVLVADQDGYCTSEILPLDFGKYVLPEYARSVLMSRMFLDYTAQCGYGVKMPRLGTEDGRKALFPLPPLREQARIVGSILSLKTILMSLQEQD